MKILLLIEGTYPWYIGGVSEWIFQYLKACSGFSFTILQIATDTYQDLDPSKAIYPLTDNIESFVRVLPPNMDETWENSLESWFMENKETLSSSVLDSDIIHVANTGFAGWLGVKLKELSGKPLILTEHAIYWLEVLKGAVALECGYKVPKSKLGIESLASLFKSIAKKVYANSDKVITVSECNIELQKKYGANEIMYIPNGIPESWIVDKKKRTNVLTIGWVGRCAEMKNPLQFFDFVDSFSSKDEHIQFLMLLSDASEYELEQEVRRRAEHYKNVEFIWNQQSKEYYQRMDMLLITSHNESQPLVLFEALANGVLPIGREVGDFGSKYGLSFVKNFSIDQISSSVLSFWNDEALRDRYINKRFELVKTDHTWEKIFKNYVSIVYQVASKKEYSFE